MEDALKKFGLPRVAMPRGFEEEPDSPVTLLKEATEAKALAEGFKTVMRCNGLEPSAESLDDVLRKYKMLVAAAEVAARVYARAGVEMPEGQ